MKKLLISMSAIAILTMFGLAGAVQAANKVTLWYRNMQTLSSCSLVAWVGDSNGTPNPNQLMTLTDQNNNTVGFATSGLNGQANFLLRRRGGATLILEARVSGFGYSNEYVLCSPARTN